MQNKILIIKFYLKILNFKLKKLNKKVELIQEKVYLLIKYKTTKSKISHHNNTLL